MSRTDPRDWSRPVLEAAIDTLERCGIRPDLLEQYRALLPHAPEYDIDHRDRSFRPY